MAAHSFSEAHIRLLQGMPIFGGLNDRTISLVLERSNRIEVAAGEFFFREGERTVATYALESGRVVIHKEWRGKERELRQLGPGDCFGEVALFDFGPRSASVRALEDCSALEVTPAILRALKDQDLEQFAMLYMNMGRELSRRLRLSDEWIFRVRMEMAETDHRYAVPST